MCSIHKKKSLIEITTNLDALAKWHKTVSFKKYEVNSALVQFTNAENVVD